jgi:hypothetical protein
MIRTTVFTAMFVALSWVVLSPGQARAAPFTGLGDLPGGIFLSFAFSVSADGSEVTGGSISDVGLEMFHWTHETGIVGLGKPGQGVTFGDSFSFPGSFDDDLEILSGGALVGDNQSALFKTVQSDLNPPASWSWLIPLDMSDDGRVIVGIGKNPADKIEAWRAVVPEPTTLALAALGSLAIGWRRRKQA